MCRLFNFTKTEKTTIRSDATILRVPLVRQSTSYTCGIACVQSILRYGGYDFDVREDILAEELSADGEKGTEYRKIVEYLNSVRYSTENATEGVQVFSAVPRTNMSLEQLTDCIDQGKPVIICLQAWADSAVPGDVQTVDYSDIWEEGHYVIAVGYNERNIFFMDPSTAETYAFIPKDEMLSRWHDRDDNSDLLNFGIIVSLTPDYDLIEAYRMK